MISIIIDYFPALASGLLVSLEICLVVWGTGLFVGTLLGMASARWRISIGLPCQVASFLLSGVPLLVMLFWVHYPLQVALGLVIDPFYSATATMSVVNVFSVAVFVRKAIDEFPAELIAAGKVCGLSPRTIFLNIQMPILMRQLIPVLLIQQVNMLQVSLFASLIGVEELFRTAQRINALVYRPVEVYTALGLFLLAICLPLNGLAYWLRERYTRNLSDR